MGVLDADIAAIAETCRVSDGTRRNRSIPRMIVIFNHPYDLYDRKIVNKCYKLAKSGVLVVASPCEILEPCKLYPKFTFGFLN